MDQKEFNIIKMLLSKDNCLSLDMASVSVSETKKTKRVQSMKFRQFSLSFIEIPFRIRERSNAELHTSFIETDLGFLSRQIGARAVLQYYNLTGIKANTFSSYGNIHFICCSTSITSALLSCFRLCYCIIDQTIVSHPF